MTKRSVVALIFALSVFAHSAEKHLVNKDSDGFALDRYDAVAFFTEGKAIKGDPKIQSTFRGARYIFASEDHKKQFDASPEQFVPQYGGFCAYGLSRGYTAPVKIETWQIVNGKLLLNYDLSVKEKFDKNQADNIHKADANWPGLVEKEAK
jgi:YHS domain-containing protein